MLDKTRLLFLVILVEGYVVLACELLAIRQLIPFVGSGTETISIIISAVLLPLAIGYHYGGLSYKRHFENAKKHGKRHLSVRKVLLKNIISALAILTLGLSYVFMEVFFALMNAINIHHRLAQTALYSGLFLVTPVFLLGQTVPLISNYFSRSKLSEITGKMLFFSTVGSFLGSVFSTIVLMTIIGVHNTVIVTLGMLGAMGLLLTRKRFNYEMVFIGLIMLALWGMNSNNTMRKFKIVSNNAYNTVSILDLPSQGAKVLMANRSASSKISKSRDNMFAYCQYIEANFIAPLREGSNETPRDILILGAGGFTMGHDDTFNRYTFVDIDKDLKSVAEEHFLQEKLSPNKRFVPMSARAFVHSDHQKYDLIIVDLYTNVVSLPMESVTREFLLDVKKLLKDDGIVLANVISSPAYDDKFTVRYNNTFASVFPTYSRQIIGKFNPWTEQTNDVNILYMYFNSPLVGDSTVYTDDRNTFSLDR